MSPTSNIDSFSWREIPGFVGVVVAISMALAIARQLGFFAMIDLKLVTIFSVEDILRNSLSVVPFTIFYWTLGATLGNIGFPIVPTRIKPGIIKFLFEYKYPIIDISIGLLFCIFYILFFDSWPILLVIQGIIIFGATASWLGQRGILDNKLAIDVLFGFYLLINAFLLGASEARTAMAEPSRNYEITLNDNSTLDVNLLRVSGDAFIVIRDINEVWVLPKSEVKLLKRKGLEEPRPLISLSKLWRWGKSQVTGWLSKPQSENSQEMIE